MSTHEQLTLGQWAKRQREANAPRQPVVPAPPPKPDTLQHYPPERPASTPRKTSYRSNLAFRRTMEAYLAAAEQAAERRGGKFVVRMWTITAADVLAYTVFMARWNDFVEAAKKKYPGFSCVRVTEVHPGEDYEIPGQPGRWDTISHGLHVHFVADKFYPQKEIQRLATKAGLGHVSVTGKTADGGCHTVASAVNYLSKYLRKGLYENSLGLRGRQMWAAINFGGAVGVRNIVTLSRWSVVFQRLSLDEDFSYYSFKMRAKIAYEGETLSLLVEGLAGGFPAVLRIQADGGFRDWVWWPDRLWKLLRPSERGHPRYHEDCELYDYLPTSLGPGWPGVEKYFEWLQSPPGVVWALEQNEARIETDRQRQRERRRELAEEKKAKASDQVLQARRGGRR